MKVKPRVNSPSRSHDLLYVPRNITYLMLHLILFWCRDQDFCSVVVSKTCKVTCFRGAMLLQYSTGYYGDGRYDQIVVFPDHTHTRYSSPASCSFNVR